MKDASYCLHGVKAPATWAVGCVHSCDQAGRAGTDLVPVGPNLNRVQIREIQKICKNY